MIGSLIIMVSLNNTVKIQNVIKNECMYITCYYKCMKGAKGLVIAAVTRKGRSDSCLICY